MTTNKVKSVVRVEPRYPANADKAGYVKARFWIDKTGRPQDIEIFESEPVGMYEDTAIKALKQWRYSPICENGLYVEKPADTQKTEVMINFSSPPVSMDSMKSSAAYLLKYTNNVPALDIDLEKSIEAVGKLSNFIENDRNISDFQKTILRDVRGKGLIAINYHRHYANKQLSENQLNPKTSVNKQEVELGIEDLVYAAQPIKPIGNRYRKIASAASILLNDNLLSNRYYEYCVEERNAACMNVVAVRSFYGLDDTVVNPRKSVYLHKQTINTGTEWGCAGYFSALHLAEISYFTEFDKEGSWRYWYETADSFVPELQEKLDKQLPCTSAYTELQKYILFLGEGTQKTELLENVLALEPKDWQIDLANALRETTDIKQPPEYFYQTKLEENQCDLGFLLVMFAKESGKQDLLDIQVNNFMGLDKSTCKNDYLMLNYANMLPAGS